jgi:hypothetical protein
MNQTRAILCILCLACVLFVGCTPAENNNEESQAYVVECSAGDEDFVNFSTVPSFMNSGSWAILEKVKIPSAATPGWHMFRGKGWEDKNGDVAIWLKNDTDSGQFYYWVYSGGWLALQMDKNDVAGLEILDNTWFTVCLQHDADSQKLQLNVKGNFIM